MRVLNRLVAFLLVCCGLGSAQFPAPDAFAGFPIGSDGNLLRWERIVEYFDVLDQGSARVGVERLGKTTNGNPFLLVTISSRANMARLDEIQRTQRRIAHPEGLTPAEIESIAWESPAVVLVTCNIHATEIASSQMVLELAYRMATEDSRWMRNVLDNVVFLLVPSLNPDGQIIVTDWNNRIKGTKNRWAPLPWLYHPYVGHDNNRDAFMMTQLESRYVNKVLFEDWFPQVYVDEHQQGNSGMRVFVPPFRNPINPNVDPAIWAEAGQIGFAMMQRLDEAGVSGVGYDQKYTAWWQGGFLRGAWFHNMVGILTEVASANLAMPVTQEEAVLGQAPENPRSRSSWYDEREKNPEAPMPAPTDVMPRYDYPRPWLGGAWSLRDIIDAEAALTNAVLETAANDRVKLIKTQIRLGLEAIEAGRSGEPWAWILPAEQHDPGALHRLLEVLRLGGVEIDRARTEFKADGTRYPAGSYLVRMAQPFRAYAKDLLEPQRHPDPTLVPRGKMGDRPYDVTAWSLPLQMGVEAAVAAEAFEVELEALEEIPPIDSRITAGRQPVGFLVRPEPNAVATAINRLWAREVPIFRLTRERKLGGERYPAGTLWASPLAVEQAHELLADLGVTAHGLTKPPEVAELQPVKPVRTGLYRPWTASMDEGWTRWLLEEYEFAVSPIFDADVRAGELGDRFDVIILPGDRGETRLVEGNARESTPEEYRGGIGDKGRRALREFVARGGTLVSWGDAVGFSLAAFELPLRNALAQVPSAEFSCPGSLLRILVDSQRPAAYGMPTEAIAVFKDDAAFEPLPGFSYTDFRVLARYPAADILAAGWIRGEEHLANRIAAAEVDFKQGKVIVIGFRPQFRAQPHNTFKLLFNSIQTAGGSGD